MNRFFKFLGVAVSLGLIAKYLGKQENTIDILARTIWGEARGDGYDGMLAVANVINNRANVGGWWGTTIVSVAWAKQQFSAWNEDDVNLDKMLGVKEHENQSFKQALEIARGVVEQRLDDNTSGATHYHTTAVSPSWADNEKIVARIGSHIFYKGIA